MTMYSIIGYRNGEIIARDSVDSISKAQQIADSWRGGLCTMVDVSADVNAIERIENAVNDPQAWLSIEPTPQADGTLSLVVNINGHFHATAADDSPAAIAKALGGLFGSMHGSVVAAADSGCE